MRNELRAVAIAALLIMFMYWIGSSINQVILDYAHLLGLH